MSAPASLYLGFDIGTQSTKALVIDPARCEVIARAQRSHGLLPDLPPGHMEQHPETWIEAVQATGREVLALVDRERIGVLGVAGQQHGCVGLDADWRG